MRQMSKRILYMIGITLLSGGTYLSAQTLNQAKELYNEGKYAEAKPVFERFVKQAPGNASYNQWYGVCCFETGDLAKAEKHLKVAVRRRVQEAYRYLGEVYYHTYRFDEAEEMFDEYVTLLAKKKKETGRGMDTALRMLRHETLQPENRRWLRYVDRHSVSCEHIGCFSAACAIAVVSCAFQAYA